MRRDLGKLKPLEPVAMSHSAAASSGGGEASGVRPPADISACEKAAISACEKDDEISRRVAALQATLRERKRKRPATPVDRRWQ